jgi:hypothetical protein
MTSRKGYAINTEKTNLRIKTENNWGIMELGDFLHSLSGLYNIIKIANTPDTLYMFKKSMENRIFESKGNKDLYEIFIYYNLGSEERINLSKITMGSPGEITLEGTRDAIDPLSELFNIALSLSRDDTYNCTKELEERIPESFIKKYGTMSYSVKTVICDALSSYYNLKDQQKIIEITAV